MKVVVNLFSLLFHVLEVMLMNLAKVWGHQLGLFDLLFVVETTRFMDNTGLSVIMLVFLNVGLIHVPADELGLCESFRHLRESVCLRELFCHLAGILDLVHLFLKLLSGKAFLRLL